MSTPSIQDLLLPGGLRASLFPQSSRYHGTDTATHTTAPTAAEPEGKSIVHLRRRFLPRADRFALLQEHVVGEGERLDNITAAFMGDPELFWRVADANNVMRPAECEEVCHRLRITLPEDVPGVADA